MPFVVQFLDDGSDGAEISGYSSAEISGKTDNILVTSCTSAKAKSFASKRGWINAGQQVKGVKNADQRDKYRKRTHISSKMITTEKHTTTMDNRIRKVAYTPYQTNEISSKQSRVVRKPKSFFLSRSQASAKLKCHISMGNNDALLSSIMEKLNFEVVKTPCERTFFCWTKSPRSLPSEFSRFGDLINHVQGEANFVNKFSLYSSVDSAYRTLSKRKFIPRCLRDKQPFLPDTYRLDLKSARDMLRAIYSPGEVWITKPASSSRGRGIFMVSNVKELNDLLQKAEDDSKKRTLPKLNDRIVQRYITNPLLINGKKFDIRSFMLIASTEPLLVLHHFGYARIALNQYSINDQDLRTHLTNQCVQMQLPEYEASKEDTTWSMEQLNSYFNEVVLPRRRKDKDWIFNVLPKIQCHVLAQVIECVRMKLNKQVGDFGLYGCDFLLDDNLRLWLLEINSGPALLTNTKVLKEVIPQVIESSVRVVLECYDKVIYGVNLLPLDNLDHFVVVYAENSGIINKSNFRCPNGRTHSLQLLGEYFNQ